MIRLRCSFKMRTVALVIALAVLSACAAAPPEPIERCGWFPALVCPDAASADG